MSSPQFIDISGFQPPATKIDWAAYKTWSAQWDRISRLSIRSSYSAWNPSSTDKPYIDGNFYAYRDAALAVGIDVIIYYHYAYPQYNSPEAEADWQWSLIRDRIRPQDVVMLDFEEGSPQANSAWALAWLKRQEANSGRLPTIYASHDYIINRLGNEPGLARYPLTMAYWTLDPNARPAAPPPWHYYDYLQYHDAKTDVPGLSGVAVDTNLYTVGVPMIHPAPLNSTGEVLNVTQADQFQTGLSQFECGAFACAMIRSGSPVGTPPQRTVAQDIANAEAWYAQQTGDDYNSFGMSTQQEYDLIKQMTYDYRVIALDGRTDEFIRAWLSYGYPVMITVLEASVFDLDLGSNPYPWVAAGRHIIDITGVRADGNWIVRDSANVASLFNPNSLRPGPRHYDANKLQVTLATVIVMPWLPEPPTGFDPTKGNPMLPQGWTDDGSLLHNPTNKNTVRGGFRSHILSASQWAPWDVPLEGEETVAQLQEALPAEGAGNRQLFTNHELAIKKVDSSIFEVWLGAELAAVRADRAAKALALSEAQTSISSLTSLLAACEASQGNITPAMQLAINDAVAAQPSLDALLTALKPFVK